METDNKQRIVNAVWDNPGPLLGGVWDKKGTYNTYSGGVEGWKPGAVRLTLTPRGDNIKMFFNHDTGRAGQMPDIFSYIQERAGLATFPETLQYMARVYGLNLELSAQERQQIQTAELARFAAASLIAAFKENPDGETARYVRDVRRLSTDGEYFGELTPDSIKRVKEALKTAGKRWTDDQLKELGITYERARAGYNLVLPYYHNGIIRGLVYRNIRPGVPDRDKYRYQSGNFGRSGYCFRLEPFAPVVMVEGQLDAIRLKQLGVINPVAFGGSEPGEEIARLLSGRGVERVTYIPDNQTDETGKRQQNNIKIVTDAIRAFQSFQRDGEPIIKYLNIADLPTPQEPDKKTDAGDYGADNAADLLARIEHPAPVWAWEFEQLREWAATQTPSRDTTDNVQATARKIYDRTRDVFQRQQIQRYITETPEFAAFGVTVDALKEADEWAKLKEYQNKITQGAADLNKAIENQANPETVGEIVRRLAEAQASNTRDEWQTQLNEPFDAELQAIADQPETLKTDWFLYKLKKTGGQYAPAHPQRIEFYPADIAVFCAPTSHGKTMVLFQTALNLLKQEQATTFLFVSCEESKRQLLERALNVYLDIPTTPAGIDSAGGYCFIEGTRKKTIKAVLRLWASGVRPDAGDDTPARIPDAFPQEYRELYHDNPDGAYKHYVCLFERVITGVRQYVTEIRPRLKFVHTEASAESICNNITHTVEEMQRQGVEVGGVFVDYMQLLTTDARNYSRHDELKDICKALKECAAQTELPVIIAAQLNRNVLKNENKTAGLDNITVANIGEGADVERIAHDIYLIWQIDKTPLQWYMDAVKEKNDDGPQTAYNDDLPVSRNKVLSGVRSRRVFRTDETTPALKYGYLYIEQMKARDGITEGWGLFPFNGERGTIQNNDINEMTK